MKPLLLMTFAMTERLSGDDLRGLLRIVENALSDIVEVRRAILELLGNNTIKTPHEELRMRIKAWAAVHKRGDVIDFNEFRTILKQIGYSPQGIGGFFAGENSSMVHVGENKVAVRRWAVEYVDRYSDWLDTVDVP